MAVVKGANLAVRFLLEVAALAALGYAGWVLAPSTPVSFALAVALPLLGASVWGRWVAPKASRRLPDPQRLAVELAVFGAAALGLVLAAQGFWAFALAGLVVVNEAALFAGDQRAY
ncbi:MAG: YrdB family protein [Actinomycetota bacterium]|nr:YrdB family protein [Actinomycetota bacterium]MDH4353568.1 YrdB family protein [Actinomycetota bacterium]